MISPCRERWAEVERALDRVLEAAPAERAALVGRICSHDPALRGEVDRLLRASEASNAFLATPATVYAAPLLARLARNEIFAPGDCLGRYRIERELGRGGMAMVYEARDHELGRTVALKVLLAELAGGIGPARFLREIRLAARLTHPNILRPYDSGRLPGCAGAEGLLYYAMPFVEGGSLRARLSREGRLAIDAAVRLACEVAGALEYAHGQGVVHRDVKPENILLGAGHAVVADFGIARVAELGRGERLTAAGVALGTPLYMSPEQSTGEAEADARSDLYSLACVLFEALAGAPPFVADTPRDVLHRRCTEAPPLVRERRADVPCAVEAALTRALARDPARRHRTAAAFAAELKAGTYAPAFRTP
jgi:serine/threonine-protein kinase